MSELKPLPEIIPYLITKYGYACRVMSDEVSDAYKERAELVDAIKAMNKSLWIKCSERLPTEKDCKRVLAYTPSPDMTMQYRVIPVGFFGVAKDATHWQPCAPPEDE